MQVRHLCTPSLLVTDCPVGLGAHRQSYKRSPLCQALSDAFFLTSNNFPLPFKNMSDFSISSRGIQLVDGHILTALCRTEDGEWVESRLDLNTFIGNDDGYFQWDGENFSHSAKNIKLCSDEGQCTSIEAYLTTRDGEVKSTSIRLDERVGNDNGRLVYY
ncbi:CVNH domain-containing protein [Dissophora ornata]|nr:CVNH domain-containing protein [Dissophora ornata]